jgi:hypothetical protein
MENIEMSQVIMCGPKESYPIPKTDLNVFKKSAVWIKE